MAVITLGLFLCYLRLPVDLQNGMQILMDKQERSVLPLSEQLSRAWLTWSDWCHSVDPYCKMWTRSWLFCLLRDVLYDFNHGFNKTIWLRIPWARVLYLESVLESKVFEHLGHELHSLIRVHCCWYPILCNYSLEQTGHLPTPTGAAVLEIPLRRLYLVKLGCNEVVFDRRLLSLLTRQQWQSMEPKSIQLRQVELGAEIFSLKKFSSGGIPCHRERWHPY